MRILVLSHAHLHQQQQHPSEWKRSSLNCYCSWHRPSGCLPFLLSICMKSYLFVVLYCLGNIHTSRHFMWIFTYRSIGHAYTHEHKKHAFPESLNMPGARAHTDRDGHIDLQYLVGDHVYIYTHMMYVRRSYRHVVVVFVVAHSHIAQTQWQYYHMALHTVRSAHVCPPRRFMFVRVCVCVCACADMCHRVGRKGHILNILKIVCADRNRMGAHSVVCAMPVVPWSNTCATLCVGVGVQVQCHECDRSDRMDATTWYHHRPFEWI